MRPFVTLCLRRRAVGLTSDDSWFCYFGLIVEFDDFGYWRSIATDLQLLGGRHPGTPQSPL
jgi:hypothetical protein